MLDHPEITEKGVKVISLLNTDIRPKKLIKIISISAKIASEKLKKGHNKSADGIYKVKSVQFVGNNFGGGVDMKIDAVKYGG